MGGARMEILLRGRSFKPKAALGNVVLSTKSPLGHRMCGYELWFPKDQVSSKDLSNDPHGLMYIDKLLHQCLLCL